MVRSRFVMVLGLEMNPRCSAGQRICNFAEKIHELGI